MKVIIHMPNEENKIEELAKKTAALHAQMVFCRIQRLDCLDEQKQEVLKELKKALSE